MAIETEHKMILRVKERFLWSVMAFSVFFTVQLNVSTLRALVSSSTIDKGTHGQATSAPLRRLGRDENDGADGASSTPDREVQKEYTPLGAFIHVGKTGM